MLATLTPNMKMMTLPLVMLKTSLHIANVDGDDDECKPDLSYYNSTRRSTNNNKEKKSRHRNGNSNS